MAKTKTNPLVVIVVIAIIAFILFNTDFGTQQFSQIQATIQPQIEFAGLTFEIPSELKCGSGSVKKEGDFLILSAQNGRISTDTDATDIDEFLIIYDGFLQASCGGSSGSNAGSGFGGSIVGDEGGSVGSGENVGTTRCQDSIGDTAKKIIEPKLWKLKNNFDGTWSSLVSLGVGDIFIVQNTQEIIGTPKLRLSVGTAAPPPCGGQTDVSGRGSLRIFNIIQKESGFAVCKADTFPSDVNEDGVIDPLTECLDIATIVLNSEEAIKESLDAKIARIELDLLMKNQGLSEEIERLKALQNTTAQQERLTQLEEELLSTNILLQKLQDREQELLDAIQANEKITVINQTVTIIQPTVINQTIIEQPIFIGGEEKGTSPLLIIGGLLIFVFILFRIL